MAREHMLRGVEETYEKVEKKPLTGKEKRTNFWYYYKFHVIVAVLIAVVLGYIIFSAVQGNSVDYSIAVGVTHATSITEEGIQKAFELYADDRNGDGKVKVSVDLFYIDKERENTDPMGYAADATLLPTTMISGQYTLFLFDEQMYAEYAEYMKEIDIDGVVGFTSEDNKAWNWDNTRFYETAVSEGGDENLMLSVRSSDRLNSSAEEDRTSSEELLIRILQDKTLTRAE